MERVICRPGGLTLTETLVTACGFPKGARILDTGCGSGATVAFLRAAGYDAAGVDLSPGDGCVTGDAGLLPFADGSFDGVLFECALSKMPLSVLHESRRVLKNGGMLGISDLYARKKPCALPHPFGRLDTRVTLETAFADAGFVSVAFADVSSVLPAYWAGYILENGMPQGMDRAAKKAADCGYYWEVFRLEQG